MTRTAAVAGLLFLGTLAACRQEPHRVFAVQIASGAGASTAASTATPGDTAGAPVLATSVHREATGQLEGKHPQWDLNRASAHDLGQLPGASGDTIQAIIAGRPYADKRELLRKAVITSDQYDAWKAYLVVHRAAR